MREKIKEFCRINDEDVLMIVLAFIAFSFGVWSNYTLGQVIASRYWV